MQISEIPFQFVGNNLALDLVNTRVAQNGTAVDLIAPSHRLAAWLDRAGGPPLDRWTAGDVDALLALRDASAQLAHAHMQNSQVAADPLACINRYLQGRHGSQKLSQGSEGFLLTDTDGDETPTAFLARIAHEIAALVTETQAKRVKSCAQEDCVLIFKDTSKSGRRRWCSMETCGNRAKAATFRAAAKR